MSELKQITEERAEKLIKQGVACLFDYPSCCIYGFHETKPHCPAKLKEKVLLATDDGNYLVRREEMALPIKEGLCFGVD